MYDLLLSRYGNIDYILDMELFDGFNLYIKAIEKEREDRLYMAWCALYPEFTKETFVSWEDFRNQHKPQQEENPVKRKTREELLSEAQAIRENIKNQS